MILNWLLNGLKSCGVWLTVARFYVTEVSSEYVPPKITLLSCLYETATFQIDNVTSGGLVFVRTNGVYNLVPTSDGAMLYDCPFEDCGISWDEKIYVVVQRNILYQTRHDVIQWFLCSTDFQSVLPVIIDFSSEEGNNTLLYTRKPGFATLKFYSNGTEYPDGSTVKLGTELNMQLEVAENEDEVFDILPRVCWATSISLLEDYCPVDGDLFGPFERLSAGVLRNTFYMFRPTTTQGGAFDVTFTCLLQVCQYSCEQVSCNESSTPEVLEGDVLTPEVLERARRDTRGPLERDKNPPMLLGSVLRAITGDEEIIETEETPSKDEFCVSMVIIIIVLATCVTALISTTVITGVSFKKYTLCQRAVGLLRQLPSGYDLSALQEQTTKSSTNSQSLSGNGLLKPAEGRVKSFGQKMPQL